MSSVNVNGFRRFFWVGLVALTLLVLLLATTGQRLSSQENGVKEIGVGGPGRNAYQFAGRIDQNGFEFTGYGYLYDVEGLAPNELFADPFNASETTAYITYYATATLTSRAVVTDATRGIFALNSVGQITFYHQSTPSASFDNPQSFANGAPITTATIRFQDILNVQSPNRGVAVGNGEFAIVSANSFTLGADTVRFGRSGIVYRVSTFGEGLRTDPFIPISSVLLSGNAIDSGFRQTFIPSVTKTNAS